MDRRRAWFVAFPVRVRGLAITTALASAMLLVGSPRPARACSCATPSSAVAAAEKASIVFIGRAAEQAPPAEQPSSGVNPDGSIRLNISMPWLEPRRFEVLGVHKGSLGDEVWIGQSRAIGCAVDYEEGEIYLVYAHEREVEGKLEYAAGRCSRTAPLADACPDIGQLAPFAPRGFAPLAQGTEQEARCGGLSEALSTAPDAEPPALGPSGCRVARTDSSGLHWWALLVTAPLAWRRRRRSR